MKRPGECSSTASQQKHAKGTIAEEEQGNISNISAYFSTSPETGSFTVGKSERVSPLAYFEGNSYCEGDFLPLFLFCVK